MKQKPKKTYQELGQSLNIHPFVLKFLLENNRSLTYHKLYYFFYGDFYTALSPFFFEHMKEVVKLVREAIKKGKGFYIVGDKDADGTSSIAILKIFFEKLKTPVFYNLPVNKESYGFNERIYNDILAHKKDIAAVITVDCGIKETEFIAKLKKEKIPTIVTDHHHPETQLPDAFIINPHVHKGEFVPLCGGALALKFVQAVTLSFSRFYDQRVLYVCSSQDNQFEGVFSEDIFTPLKEKKVSFTLKELEKILKKGDILNVFCDDSTLATKLRQYKKSEGNTQILSLEELYYHYTKDKGDNKKIYHHLKILFDKNSILHSLSLVVRKIIYFYHLKLEQKLAPFLMLASVATVCDRMPMNHYETRSLLKSGFKYLFESSLFSPLKLLFTKSLDYYDKEKFIGMYLGPLLNAAGRLGKAHHVVEFLIADENEAKEKLDILKFLNQQRQKIQKENWSEILNYLELHQKEKESSIVFYASYGIAQGVTGLLANKVSKEIKKPVVIVSLDKERGIGVGSGRSGDFPIHPVFEAISDKLEAFGGHAKACGFSIKLENLEILKKHLTQFDFNTLSSSSSQKEGVIPLASFSSINTELINSLELLGPFGEAHHKPLFESLVTLQSTMIFGKESKHIKIKSLENPLVNIILWQNAHQYDSFVKNTKLKITYNLSKDSFKSSLNAILYEFPTIIV
jgi:single-stranded-DNA-specific exonuclease